MIIDCYPHLFPAAYLKAVDQTYPTATIKFHLGNERFYDAEFRIKTLDRYKVDLQVINVAGGLPLHEPASPEVKAARESRILARLANDEIAKIVERYPNRFAGIGVLPLAGTGESLDELDRCVEDLGLKGVCIWTSDIPMDKTSKELDQFYEKMVKYDLPVLIHPSFGQYVREPEEYAVGISLGWPFETAMAMTRLVYGGVFDRFPRIKFVTHHCGSMIPYFNKRIKTFYDSVMDGSEAALDGLYYPGKLSKNPIEYFKLFYNDTVVAGSVESLSLAISFFGHEHIMLGTDYPYGPLKGDSAFLNTLGAIEKLNLSSKEREAVLGGNARRLFRL